ncbi:unnamed protein product [Symbiodinium pilosum]|uniref:Uncharacterized protein n=1 Tax=Symbiodinium pilosum TaxID=2952 RepID=A0A812M6E7_SYMPI|nr:unnamed protein product [Symbiodinium pilosum]
MQDDDEERDEDDMGKDWGSSRLQPSMEDRTFGVLSMLLLEGSENLQARATTSGYLSARWRLSKERPDDTVRGDASPKSARKRFGVQDKFGFQDASATSARGDASARGWDASPRGQDWGASIRLASITSHWRTPEERKRMPILREVTQAHADSPVSPRGGAPKSARARHGASKDPPDSGRGQPSARGRAQAGQSARGGEASARGDISSRGGASERSGQSGEEPERRHARCRCFRCCCCRGRGQDEQLGDDEFIDSEAGNGKSSRGDKDIGNVVVRLADHVFASLRNVAAHSAERRKQILGLQGEQVGVEALALFRGRDAGPSRSVAAFLRNLSEGSDGVVPLANAGFLQLAEEELDDNLGGPQVRRHILAALQNMAAQVGQSEEVFTQPASWLEMCGIASQRGLQDRDARATQQALGAMGNFAVLRAAQEL